MKIILSNNPFGIPNEPQQLDRLVRDKFNYPSQKMMIKCLQQNSKLLNHQMPEILQIYRPQQQTYALFQMFSHLQLFFHGKIQCFQIHIIESVLFRSPTKVLETLLDNFG